VNYLDFAQSLLIAEAVTNTDVETLLLSPRIELLDSAINVPSASFGGEEAYKTFPEKIAALGFHIARNHPLLDGNKRLAWESMVMFAVINDHELSSDVDTAVEVIFNLAAGEVSQEELTRWVEIHLSKVSGG
jgi:death-on-curing protein